MPELAGKSGHDLVTSSGDTLLGADDKAGVAEIMTAVAHLAAHPDLPRPTLRIGFTPDEEIGEGATLFDVERFGARCAYTLDGSTIGELQDETFTGVEAIVTIEGVEVHPGLRDRQARQPDPPRRARARRAARGADAGAHVGPRGLHPPLRRHRLRRPGGDPADRPRLRRRPARAARRGAAAHGRGGGGSEPRARAKVDVRAPVPEHAQLPRAVPGDRARRPSARSARRASSRCARRSAAGPTARA